MLQSSVLRRFVAEPRTIAGFPAEAANHTELGSAATGHVIASLFELDHSRAIEAALPSFGFRHLDKPLRLFVVGAFAADVPFPVASTTDLGFAPPTLAVLPPAIGTARRIDVNVCRFDPLAATSSGTVDTVFSRILLKLLVPFDLELIGKQFLHMFQGDMIGGTAFRGHVLRIRGRHNKDSLEAIVTHAVPAGK